GFVDMQVNGLAGHDAASGAAAITEISRLLPKYGVVGFMPTLISRPIPEAVRFVEEVYSASGAGAAVLGAHIEGPFINPNYRGAHDVANLALPAWELVHELVDVEPSMVTLAPELPGALDAIRELTSAHVNVSAGHSGATMAEAIAGRETTSDGTSARLADGTLAGGVATMDQMVRLVAGLPGVGLRDAVRMASVSEYGLRTRGRADLVVLTPDLHVRLTMVGGRVVHG